MHVQKLGLLFVVFWPHISAKKVLRDQAFNNKMMQTMHAEHQHPSSCTNSSCLCTFLISYKLSDVRGVSKLTLVLTVRPATEKGY